MKSFSEHFDVKTELSQLFGTEHSNTCSDINFQSYNNNRDDNIFSMVILTSVINYPEVDNVNSNSGLQAQSKRRRVIDRVGFVNGNKDTGSLWGSRVWEEHSLEHFDINVHSPGEK